MEGWTSVSLDVTWCRWSCRHRCIPYKHSAYHLHSDSHRPVCSCKCRSSLRAGSLPGTICVTLCNCVIPCGCPFESVIKIFKLFFSLIYFYIFLAWKAYRTSHTMPLFVCLPICLLTSDRFHPGCRFFFRGTLSSNHSKFAGQRPKHSNASKVDISSTFSPSCCGNFLGEKNPSQKRIYINRTSYESGTVSQGYYLHLLTFNNHY